VWLLIRQMIYYILKISVHGDLLLSNGIYFSPKNGI
jgi:hypothetical protein